VIVLLQFLETAADSLAAYGYDMSYWGEVITLEGIRAASDAATNAPTLIDSLSMHRVPTFTRI
jgi:hypothetical protein